MSKSRRTFELAIDATRNPAQAALQLAVGAIAGIASKRKRDKSLKRLKAQQPALYQQLFPVGFMPRGRAGWQPSKALRRAGVTSRAVREFSRQRDAWLYQTGLIQR